MDRPLAMRRVLSEVETAVGEDLGETADEHPDEVGRRNEALFVCHSAQSSARGRSALPSRSFRRGATNYDLKRIYCGTP